MQQLRGTVSDTEKNMARAERRQAEEEITRGKVAVYTLGCKVNQYESAAMAGLFEKKGYQIVDFKDFADIYIINTCTVTHLGDRKSRQMIRRAVRKNPDALVVVAGCYAQVAPEEVLKIPGVDLVVGTRDRSRIVEMVEETASVRMRYKDGPPANMVKDVMDVAEIEEFPCPVYHNKTRAFVKIQEGCENYCSYCIIPYARGPLRSRRPENVLAEIESLVNDGYKEIVLTGIHIGAYGRDFVKDIDLASLVEKILLLKGLKRLRISSLEPQDVTPELIELMAGSPVFCRHFHLPLQSGDDEILSRMRRQYTTRDYAALLDNIRAKVEDVAVTSDIMVGFPGEREENFNNTFKFIKEMHFSGLHVFKYSPRRGTPAAGFSGKVPPEVKERRSRKLIDLSRKLFKSFAARFLGQTVEVLVEQPFVDGGGNAGGGTNTGSAGDAGGGNAGGGGDAVTAVCTSSAAGCSSSAAGCTPATFCSKRAARSSAAGYTNSAAGCTSSDAETLYEGLTGNYIKTVFPGSKELQGKFVRVRLEKVVDTYVRGRII